MFTQATIALSLGLIAMSTQAADIYQWVDEQGRTHMSDTVPDKYKRKAQRMDSEQFELKEAERRQAAAQRAALLRNAASTSAASAPQAPAIATSPSADPTRPGTRRAAASAPTAPEESCETLQRRYKEAQDCFGAAPKTAGGGINAAAAPQCPALVDPSPRCGLPNVPATWPVQTN